MVPAESVMLCLAILSSVHCQAQADESIKLGLFLPNEPLETASIRQGALIAIEQANQAGEPKIDFAVRGRPGQWGTEGDEAVGLALDESVHAILTPADGTATHQILQVAGRTRIPVASLCADMSITRAGVPWAIRIVPSTIDDASALFAGLTNHGFSGAWTAVVPPERAGRESARDLAEAASMSRIPWREPHHLPPRSSDHREVVRQIVASNPKIVLLWTDPIVAGKLARQLREAGFLGTFAGPGRLWSHAFLQTAGTAADGVIVPTPDPANANADQLSRFQRQYQERFGTEPDVLSLMAHDAAFLMITLLKKSGSASILNSFPVRDRLDGTSGPLHFDKDGNRLGSLVLMTCRAGRFVRFQGPSILKH